MERQKEPQPRVVRDPRLSVRIETFHPSSANGFMLINLLDRYNMVTASTQVTHAQVTETSTTPPVVDPSTITYQPTYNIDSSFRAVTEAWIATAGQQGKEPFKLEFSAGGCSHPDKEWENVGFESVRHSSDDVAPILPLFTTSQACDGNHNKLKTSLGDEGHDSRVTVTLTASDAKVFNINSGNW